MIYEKCVSFQNVAYNFIDMQTGKLVSGASPKCCLCGFDSESGACVSLHVEKVAKGFVPPADTLGTFTFDRFKRVAGFTPAPAPTK